ncbi:MAG: DUF2341 domain-containing protein, partial [Kiritimatiellae bacterium]|nr:DUF2341 domain-containing protein [Kiritimatiellia bacterium]
MSTKKQVAFAAVALAAALAYAKPVTMMSYNIRIGCGLNDPFNLPPGGLGHLPQVASVIRQVNPDWVAVQEIDSKTKRAGFVDQTKALAELCGMKGVFVRKTLNTSENEFRMPASATDEEFSGCGEYGLAVLSKEEPLKISKVLVPGYDHTRCVEFVEFKDYVVACTHFPLEEEYSLVAAQVAMANAADYRKPVFLAGDFNAPPTSSTIAELEAEMTILNDTAVPTFPSSGPTSCIDYIMVDTPHADRVSVTERRVIADASATDHCAVVVKAEVACDDGWSQAMNDATATTATYCFDWYAGDAVANFPAPMTLSEGLNGFSYAGLGPGGCNLRVKDMEGNLLPHEIEKWDPDGYSIVWVKLPSLSQSATVMLSWGDPDAATATGSLWDDAVNVFHFGDDIKKDSSKWSLDSAQTPDVVVGIVGDGMTSATNGTKRFLVDSVTPSALGLNGSTPFTIAFWLKGSASSESNYLYHMRTKSNPDAEVIVTYNYNEPRWGNVWPRTVELIGSGISRADSHIEAPDFGWHHFAYTYDGSNVRKYLDGELVGTVAASKTLKVWLDDYSSIEQRISVGGGTGGQNLSGATFDEVRLEPVCRSAAWIKALALTSTQVHDNDGVYEMSFPEYTGTETLTNFPLMVTLDDRLPGLPDSVKAAMRDVRRLYFYTADGGTELQYEMELTPTEGGTAAT